MANLAHEKQVADLAVDLTKFMIHHPQREIIVWQRVLAETQLKLAKRAAELVEEKSSDEADDS